MKKNENKEQVKAFKAMARELGCDESEGAFDAAVTRAGKADPKVVEATIRKGKAAKS